MDFKLDVVSGAEPLLGLEGGRGDLGVSAASVPEVVELGDPGKDSCRNFSHLSDLSA